MLTLEAPRVAEFGPLVGEHKQGDTVLWLFRRGLLVARRRARFAGGFQDIRGVYLDDQNQPPRLRLKLPGRLWVRLTGGDQQADATLRGLLRMSTPALLSRGAAEYDAGKTVDFGALRLSKQRIAVRRGLGWRRLPLAELSGWVVRNGWLFLDQGHRRPERFAEVRLRRIANLEVLIALLRKGRAETDLSQPANALRHAARGRTLIWQPTTALARRPRTARHAFARLLLLAGSFAAGGFLGLRYDVVGIATSVADTLQSIYQWVR